MNTGTRDLAAATFAASVAGESFGVTCTEMIVSAPFAHASW